MFFLGHKEAFNVLNLLCHNVFYYFPRHFYSFLFLVVLMWFKFADDTQSSDQFGILFQNQV